MRGVRVGPALLVVVSACGRVSFDGRGDGSQIDAPLGAFGAPMLVSEVSYPLTDDDPTATGDALELFWASERGGAPSGYADIYTVTRTSLDAPWSTPTPVAELNSSLEDQSPGITGDGLTIYFASRRPSGAGSNIWMATRSSRGATWSTPTMVAELSSAMDEFEPQPDASNTRIVLYRQMSMTDTALLMATRASPADAWGTPTVIVELDTPVLEKSPFLTADGLTIYYSSTNGMTTSDLYVATRSSTTGAFMAGVPMSELETPMNDDDPWLSSDGHVMFFASDRSGNFEIYETRR